MFSLSSVPSFGNPVTPCDNGLNDLVTDVFQSKYKNISFQKFKLMILYKTLIIANEGTERRSMSIPYCSTALILKIR
jgi:hypothetical protein